jgi:hypothetical protein
VRLTSQFTDGLFQAGLAGSVLFNPDRNAAPMAIATGFAILLLPYSILGPFVGVFLDRWRRRQVIYRANLIRAVLVIPTALMIRSDIQGWGFASLALAVIAINRFFLSGMSASQPLVVHERRLVTANSVAGTLGTVGYSLGLGTSALLLHFVFSADSRGYGTVASFATVGYAIAALLAFRWFAIDDLGPVDSERADEPMGAALWAVAVGMVAGVRHLTSRRGAAYGLATQSGYRFLYGVLTLSTLLLYRNHFYPGDEDGALSGLFQVVLAGAIGAILAAFITPSITRKIGGWAWLTGLLAASSVFVTVLGLQFSTIALVAATFLINIASQGMKIVVDTALQRECSDSYRGRVFSVNDTLFNLCWVMGLFLAAATLPIDGQSALAILLIGAGLAVLAIWYGTQSHAWVARAGDDIAQPKTEELAAEGAAN